MYNGVDSTIGYNGVDFASYDIVTPDSTSFAHYLQGSSAGVAPISNKILDEMGMSLSYGTLPTSDDECLIPLCQYEQFAKYGFQHQDIVLPAKEIQTPSAFLGFSPSLYVNFGSSGATMRIVGFVDTKLDYNDYPSTISSDTQKGNAALTELSDEFAYGPNRLVFVAPSMIANNFPSNQAINIGNSEELRFNSGSYQQSFANIYQADSSNSISLAGINDSDSIYLPLGAFGEALGTYSLPLAVEEEVDYSPCKSYFTPFSSLKVSSALQDPKVFFAVPISDNFSVLSLAACGSYVKTNGLPSEGKELTDLINFAQNDYDQALVQGTVSAAIDFSSRSDATDDILKSFYTLYLASNYNETIGEAGGFLKNSFGSRSGYQITFDFSQRLFSRIGLGKTINVSLGVKSAIKGEYSLSGILGGLYFEAFDVFRAKIGLSTDLFNVAKTSLGDCGPIAFFL